MIAHDALQIVAIGRHFLGDADQRRIDPALRIDRLTPFIDDKTEHNGEDDQQCLEHGARHPAGNGHPNFHALTPLRSASRQSCDDRGRPSSRDRSSGKAARRNCAACVNAAPRRDRA